MTEGRGVNERIIHKEILNSILVSWKWLTVKK